MKCKKVKQNFLLLLDTELSKKRQLQIQRHLNNCPACRQQLSRIKGLYETFDNIDTPAPSPWLWTRISAAVNDYESHLTIFTRLQAYLPKFAVGLAMFLLLAFGVGVGIFIGSPSETMASTRHQKTIDSAELYAETCGLDAFDAMTPQSISSVYAVFSLNNN